MPITNSTASLAGSEEHIGEVGMPDDVLEITCSLDTGGAYAAGDVLFDTQEIANAVRVNGGVVILTSIRVLDKDDQGAEMNLVFFDANQSLGTENSAPDITDTEAEDVLGHVNIAESDYLDLGACQVATKKNIGLELKAGAGLTSLFVASITEGTPTHTASGLMIKFGFLRN